MNIMNLFHKLDSVMVAWLFFSSSIVVFLPILIDSTSTWSILLDLGSSSTLNNLQRKISNLGYNVLISYFSGQPLYDPDH